MKNTVFSEFFYVKNSVHQNAGIGTTRKYDCMTGKDIMNRSIKNDEMWCCLQSTIQKLSLVLEVILIT
jgi:hypothetical protein